MTPTFTRAALLAGILFCGVQSAEAQDIIHLDDGSEIEAKVTEINQRNIVYRRWDNQNGADYVLNRSDVQKIVYENGTEEELSGRRNTRPSPFSRDRSPMARSINGHDRVGKKSEPGYGKNIIAIAPIQMTNESVAGVGIHFERFLDKGNIFSLYIPVAFAFFQDEMGPTGIRKDRVYTYVYPGAKFYPGGSNRRVSYSVGPSFGFGFGTKQEMINWYHPTYGYSPRNEEVSSFKAGFMVNNGLNIQPTKALYIGLELGFGILYYENHDTQSFGGDEPMVQFNFKMGYRF